MNKKQKNGAVRLAAIELNATALNVCVRHTRADGQANVQTLSLPWRHSATALHSELGVAELTETLKRIATDLRLQGAETWMSLAGDYCVTRVVTGSEEHVRHELAELEARSELYISLGHGPKALAGSIRQIDARQRHALLSVVNQKTLDILNQAASQAGLQLERIEPSLVSICRLVGKMQVDAESPVLVMHVGEKGSDLGISHRGVLLLDYRPAGAESAEAVGGIVNRHLARLQRYCQRYARVSGAKLQNVYLAGPPGAVAAVADAIRTQGDLTVHVLDNATAIDDTSQWDNAAPAWSLAVPVGMALLQHEQDRQHGSPNLLERLRRANKIPLAQLLRPLVLPLAAALAVVGLGWLGVWYQAVRCGRIELLAAEVENGARDVRLQQKRLEQAQSWIHSYERMSGALTELPLSEITTHLAQSLPDDVWLDDIALDPSGRLSLTGGSYSDDGVFEFAKHLERISGLSNVAVEATRSVQFPGGKGTQFDVHGEIAEQTVMEGSNDGRG
jgi:Tfp pilus assembly protein PilN